jgi:hypothetical protein
VRVNADQHKLRQRERERETAKSRRGSASVSRGASDVRRCRFLLTNHRDGPPKSIPLCATTPGDCRLSEAMSPMRPIPRATASQRRREPSSRSRIPTSPPRGSNAGVDHRLIVLHLMQPRQLNRQRLGRKGSNSITIGRVDFQAPFYSNSDRFQPSFWLKLVIIFKVSLKKCVFVRMWVHVREREREREVDENGTQP